MAEAITIIDQKGVSRKIKINDEDELVIQLSDTETNEVVSKTAYEDENKDTQIVDIQNPLPIDGDSVYAKDLDSARGTYTNWTGDPADLFGDLLKGIVNSSSDNPKSLTIWFNRPVITNGMGIGAVTGNFSNTKITAITASGLTVLVDESTDNTDKQTLEVQFAPTGFTGLILEFFTSDEVNLSTIFVAKSRQVVSRIQGKSNLTGLIEDISTYRNTLNVNNAWVHRKIVNETYHQHTGTETTPSIAISAGDISATFTSVVGFAAGGEIKITENSIQEIGLITITDITGSVVTFDRPIGNDYTTSAIIVEVITNMAVNGSLSVPEIFEIDPPTGVVWQFTRILPTIVDNLAPDDGKFGGIPALENGVSLRATTSAGRTVVFANWKTNGDMKLDMFNVEYTDKAPAGNHGVHGRWTFTTAEIVAELDGDASPIQKLEVLIQDDLTDLITFRMRGQGRVFSP